MISCCWKRGKKTIQGMSESPELDKSTPTFYNEYMFIFKILQIVVYICLFQFFLFPKPPISFLATTAVISEQLKKVFFGVHNLFVKKL